jgi:Flp pilus assembly protein TadG
MMPARRDKALARPGLRALRPASPGRAGPTEHRRSTAKEAGSVLVEFAMLVTLLLMLAVGAIDYGSMANQQAMLEGATRAGAEYARANPSDATSTPAWTNTQNRVTGFAAFSPAPNATVGTVCTSTDNTTVTCPSGPPNPCAAKSDPTLVEYVSVTATQTFNPVVPWGSFFFPASLSAGTLTRIQ